MRPRPAGGPISPTEPTTSRSPLVSRNRTHRRSDTLFRPEGMVVHDRVSTSSGTPFRTATVPVTVSDGSLDLDLCRRGRVTRSVRQVVHSKSFRLGGWDNNHCFRQRQRQRRRRRQQQRPRRQPLLRQRQPLASTTTAPTTTASTTTAPTTTAPTTTASTTTAGPPADPIRYSFTPRNAPNGWIVATGHAFDGFHGMDGR